MTLLVLSLVAVGVVSAQSEIDPATMPKGGRALLLQVLGAQPDRAELKRIAKGNHTAAEWKALFADRTQALSDRERQNLADYLAINMPLEPALLARMEKRANPASVLPFDGQEVAAKFCRGGPCHTLSTVVNGKFDAQGWIAELEKKQHKGVGLRPKWAESFIAYAAANFPMK